MSEKKIRIPNNITGCINLLKENFGAGYILIDKSNMYFDHTGEIETEYYVYVADICSKYGLKDFQAVRKYIKRIILNKEQP